ncbi:MAG: group III truncated hemoglobin, partial [Bacteroidia bacterium]
VNLFYEKIKKDKTLNHYFTEVVKVDWENHLSVMYKFWENIIFYSGTYSGNPMQQHFDIHKKSQMSMNDFQQWTILFNQAVDELFDGGNANLIKQRAQNISTIMQMKLFK